MTLKNNVFSLLIASAIFLAPINLFAKWGESQAYVGGIFTDYLVQRFWIGEIPVLLIIGIWLFRKILHPQKKILPFLKKNGWWMLALTILGARQFFTSLPSVSVWYFMKLLEWLLFGWCLFDSRRQIHLGLVRYALMLALIFQSFVATAQFVRQQPLFEYSVLGETQFTQSINIAKADFRLGQVSLPYGTTAHPNILAGITAVYGILWLQLQTEKKRKIPKQYLPAIALISWVLFLTQSVSAILAFLFFLFSEYFSQYRKYFLPAAVVFLLIAPVVLMLLSASFTAESVFRRAFLNAHAVSVAAQQPLLGTGLGLFTTTLKDTAGSSLSQFVRFIQPAHNGLLLWLAETGLLGSVFLMLGIKKLQLSKHATWLLVIVPLLSLDHYLLTQWAGGMLLTLSLVLQEIRREQQA